MQKLFCGHWIDEIQYAEMFQNRQVRCPYCGTEWRGTMVIARDKGQARRDMFDAERRGRESKNKR